MTNYDESFDPAAPIAKIVLRNIETGKRVKDIFVLLDTGADISLLPLSAINQLQIEPSDESVNLVGFDESVSVSELYRLQIIFLGIRFTGEYYCAMDDKIGILGRDILNEFSIIFDGKNLVWKKQ